MSAASDRRLSLPVAAFGFLSLDNSRSRMSPQLAALHAWLDSWRGVGLIIDVMLRQGYRVSVRNIAVDSGWIATFSRDPMTSDDGFGSGETPWLATQRAAWTAVKRRVWSD